MIDEAVMKVATKIAVEIRNNWMNLWFGCPELRIDYVSDWICFSVLLRVKLSSMLIEHCTMPMQNFKLYFDMIGNSCEC